MQTKWKQRRLLSFSHRTVIEPYNLLASFGEMDKNYITLTKSGCLLSASTAEITVDIIYLTFQCQAEAHFFGI